jgi:hypothetical protein
MAVFTDGGLNLLATALQTTAGNAAMTYVAVGLGAGTLASTLTSGSPYTSLPLVLPLAVGVANGQLLTIIDTTGDTQIVTATGNSIGATALGVLSFVASATFVAGSGIVNTPDPSDNALQNETWRVPSAPGAAGAGTGESLNTGYVDPSAPTAQYLEVGFYGGTATGSLGSGTLIARDVQFWTHVTNMDSASFQLDSTI